jgi:hypothetical protein
MTQNAKMTYNSKMIENYQKWSIKYTFLYPGVHEQSLYIGEYYL